MNANGAQTRAKATTLAFRYPKTRRAMLEAIQQERGHSDLSVTLREAVDQYIERHLRRDENGAAA
jgi:hypothetical protein